MFVWVWGFAWIVWLLCACGVRRFRGLWRVCLYFVLFCPILSSILSFCSCVCLSFCPLCSCFYLFSCFPRLVLLAAWLLILVLSSLFVGCCCFFFPYGIYAKRKGAPCLVRPLSSCCGFVMGLLYA